MKDDSITDNSYKYNSSDMNTSKSSSDNLPIKIVNLDEKDENNILQTKKKSLFTDINPHLIRRNLQKEECVWLGVYDILMRNKRMIQILQNCEDKTIPLVF